MWFWEVLFEDTNGVHSIFSLNGYETADEARMFFEASELRLMQELRNREGILVDISIVYRIEGPLYEDPDEVF